MRWDPRAAFQVHQALYAAAQVRPKTCHAQLTELGRLNQPSSQLDQAFGQDPRSVGNQQTRIIGSQFVCQA